jgi:hypothetical protein
MKADLTCFGLQGNHHQGATTSTQLKIEAWFNVDTDVVSVMAAYYGVCVVHCVSVYAHTVHNTHATQVILCRHNTDVCTTSVSTTNQACIFRYVLAVAP